MTSLDIGSTTAVSLACTTRAPPSLNQDAGSTRDDIRAWSRKMRWIGLHKASWQLGLSYVLEAGHHYKQVLRPGMLQEELGKT